jgi:hypothetical protein
LVWNLLQQPEIPSPQNKQKQQHPKQQLSSTPSPRKRSSGDKSRPVKDVPRFYWPEGKPPPSAVVQDSLTKAEEKLKTLDNSITYNKFGEVNE